MSALTERRMAGDVSSTGLARDLVRSTTAGLPASTTDTAVLLADELVTNAVLHGGGQFTLTVVRDDACLRVTVADLSAVAPQVLTPSLEGEHGRGMAIVERLASAWGTVPTAGGKLVWFELELTDRTGAGA